MRGKLLVFLIILLTTVGGLDVVHAEDDHANFDPGQDVPMVESPPPPDTFGAVNPDSWEIIELYVPPLAQSDPAWASDVMQTCGQTIQQSGCALTSVTMVFQYYGDTHTPKTENTCLGTKACPIYWATAANNCSSGQATYKNSYSISESDVSALTYNGLYYSYPPIAKTQKGTGYHYVVVKKAEGDGSLTSSYTIIDSWDGIEKNLAQYLEDTGRTLVAYLIYTHDWN